MACDGTAGVTGQCYAIGVSNGTRDTANNVIVPERSTVAAMKGVQRETEMIWE